VIIFPSPAVCVKCGTDGFYVIQLDEQTCALTCSNGHELRLFLGLTSPPVPEHPEHSEHAARTVADSPR
jgi:hypothetical protein